MTAVPGPRMAFIDGARRTPGEWKKSRTAASILKEHWFRNECRSREKYICGREKNPAEKQQRGVVEDVWSGAVKENPIEKKKRVGKMIQQRTKGFWGLGLWAGGLPG